MPRETRRMSDQNGHRGCRSFCFSLCSRMQPAILTRAMERRGTASILQVTTLGTLGRS